MAQSIKFSTTQPNNSIKGSMTFTPESTVYVEKTNVMGQLENVQWANDIDLSLNTYEWGTSGTVLIPTTYNFLGNIYLRLDILCTGTASGDAKVFLPSDFSGYSFLRSFTYRIPGCERMTFDGEAIPYAFLDECETMEKRQEFLRITGKAEDVACTTGGYKTLFLLLPLPWCSPASDPKKRPKPFPAYMLKTPIELEFRFRSKIEVVTKLADYDAKISSAKVVYEYASLGAQTEYKNAVYKYPFQSKYFLREYVTKDSQEIVLKGVRNGETTQLRFAYIPDFQYNAASYYAGYRMDNLRLEFGGQVIWKAEDNMQDVWAMRYNELPTAYNGSTMLVPYDGSDTKAAIVENWKRAVMIYNLMISDAFNLKASQLMTAAAADVNDTITEADAATCATKMVTHFNTLVQGTYFTSGITAPTAASTAVDSKAAPYLRQMNFVLSQVKMALYRFAGLGSVRYRYYSIPVAEILDHVKGQGYSLGTDFNKSDLKLRFDALPHTGYIFFETSVSSMYQLDGVKAIMIQ